MVSPVSLDKLPHIPQRGKARSISSQKSSTEAQTRPYLQDAASLSMERLSSPKDSFTQIAQQAKYHMPRRANSFTSNGRTPDARYDWAELQYMSGSLQANKSNLSTISKSTPDPTSNCPRVDENTIFSSEAQKAFLVTEANLDKLISKKPDLSTEEQLALEFGIDLDEQKRLLEQTKNKSSQQGVKKPSGSPPTNLSTSYIKPSKPSPSPNEFRSLSKPIEINGYAIHTPSRINCRTEQVFAERPLAYFRDKGDPCYYEPTAPTKITNNGTYLHYLQRTLRHPDNKDVLIEIKGQVNNDKVLSKGKLKKITFFSSDLVDASKLTWRLVSFPAESD